MHTTIYIEWNRPILLNLNKQTPIIECQNQKL